MDREAAFVLKCHLCGGNSIGIVVMDDYGLGVLQRGQGEAGIEKYDENLRLAAVIPHVETTSAPEAVPRRAAVFFVEAKDDLRSGRDPAGIISKCRSVLDLCLNELKAAGAGRRSRIADLRAKGLLSESLAKWADKLWDDGNDAIHDLVGESENARQHVAFLELFFEVAFVLPDQVERAQGPPPK